MNIKKIVPLAACLLLVITLFSGCSKGDVKNVEIEDAESEIYSQDEIKAAEQAVINYFEKEFSGCTLQTLQYAGDDEVKAEQDVRNSDDEFIVFTSSFDVDESGGDGSLNPKSTYTGWKWIFSRTQGGQWSHVDHGYG